MTIPHFIRHVILTTGAVRDSGRSEADNKQVAMCSTLIARINAGSVAESFVMAGISGYSISGRIESKCMLATLWAEKPAPERIASIAVARHEVAGAKLWSSLHRISEVLTVTNPDRQPHLPWSATLLEPSFVPSRAGEWLDTFELCLAWAWLEQFSKKGLLWRMVTSHGVTSPAAGRCRIT